jgi:hypothetical protein
MQFTQGQLREVLGISVETFRHWKRLFPPFAERRPYKSGYSIGDLLAAGILHRLTDRCGVRAGHLAKISKTIVEICNANTWAVLEEQALQIDIQCNRCRLARRPQDDYTSDVTIVCPFRAVMSVIQEGVERIAPAATQRNFGFRPVPVGEVRAQRRRA